MENLSPKHREVLRAIVDTEKRGVFDYVYANDDFPTVTLLAMERRGLVQMSWMREGMIGTSDKPYRIARITEKGRAALNE